MAGSDPHARQPDPQTSPAARPEDSAQSGGWTPNRPSGTRHSGADSAEDTSAEDTGAEDTGAEQTGAGHTGVDSDTTGESDERLFREPDEGDEQFSLSRVFGGWSGLLDIGLPTITFIATFTLTGRELRPAVLAAVVVGLLIAVVRIVTKKPLQNVIAGFFAVALSGFITWRTGQAQDYFLVGLLTNAGYCLAYLIGNLLRYPVLGIIIGLAAGWGMSWRKDPLLVRAFTRAGWVWVGGFVLRLVVQVPLYLGGEEQVAALGVARVAMGAPFWGVVLVLTYVIIKGSVPSQRWRTLRMSVDHLGRGGAGRAS